MVGVEKEMESYSNAVVQHAFCTTPQVFRELRGRSIGGGLNSAKF